MIDQQSIPEEAIEAAAKALYEASRDPGYTESEWDWPNIDKSYDRFPDVDDGNDPEWARNLYRADAWSALAAAFPLIEAAIREQIASEIESYCRPKCDERPYENDGYNCCGCSTYDKIVDDAVRIARGSS